MKARNDGFRGEGIQDRAKQSMKMIAGRNVIRKPKSRECGRTYPNMCRRKLLIIIEGPPVPEEWNDPKRRERGRKKRRGWNSIMKLIDKQQPRPSMDSSKNNIKVSENLMS